MSDQTFEQLYKKLLLYAPDLPLQLAKEFINTSYSRTLSAYEWYSLRTASAFYVAAPYSTGTVTVTNGSTTVTGSGTSWTSSMEGRQLIIGGQKPFYDIETVGGATSLTLRSAYTDVGAAGITYSIDNVMLECPADFLTFLTVVDTSNSYRLHTGLSQDILDTWDPARTRSTSPSALVAAPISSSARGNLVRFEIWPRLGAAQHIPYRYVKRPALLSSVSDTPIFPVRGDVIKEGALAQLALWPGTRENPNTYYAIEQHRMHEQRYRTELNKCWLDDQGISPTDISYVEWETYPWAPLDAEYLQTNFP